MTRRIWLGKCGTMIILGSLLGGCSDLGNLATMPARTDPAAVPSHRADGTAEQYLSVADKAAAAVRTALVEQNLPGVSVAVAVGGRQVWAEGFGWADLTTKAPVTPATRFRIGDVTIPITAAAVGVLVERGQLDLDTPVQTYVAFPQESPITARQLMANTSGIRDRGGEEGEIRTGCGTDAARLAPFANDKLRFEPGSNVTYSTYGWVLVGAVIAANAGEPYLDFLQREVLGPLGMADTVAETGTPIANTASKYYPVMMLNPRRGLQTASIVNLDCVMAAGGLISTPSDLVRFATGLMAGGLLRPETLATLQTPVQLTDGRPTAEGLGWRLRTIPGSDGAPPIPVIGHDGDPFGGSATLMVLPDYDIVVAIASNVTAADTEALAGAIARLFVDQ